MNSRRHSDEKTLQSLDSLKTVITEVDDTDHAITLKEIELNVQDLQMNHNELRVTIDKDNNIRKNSGAVLSVSSDQESCIDTRKNSNTSIRTVQSMPKYTECMAADKPFANISNRRMIDNITRAVSCLLII